MIYEPAFPAELELAASTLLSALTKDELYPALQGFIVTVQAHSLSAPYRVYYAPDRLRFQIRSLTGEARLLALCLGTRHWDGHIREECVRELVAFDRPWVIPFIVQLLGEYVIQIVHIIVAALPHFNKFAYGEFVRANPQYYATTKRRAVSYWNCYYRNLHPSCREYPALLAIDQIEGLA